MSVSPSTVLLDPTSVSVAPTETTLAAFTREQLRTAKRIVVQVCNLDGSQTFSGIIYRKKSSMADFAPSSIGDFASVGPGLSAMVDLDIEGTDQLEVRGTMSGAGGSVQIGANRKAATP